MRMGLEPMLLAEPGILNRCSMLRKDLNLAP
jgi:hypothetical protein